MSVNEGREGARQVKQSTTLDLGARVGFAATGVLHLLIGYLAVKLAFHRTSTAPDQSGALATLAHQSAGNALLVVFIIGFVALALWQLVRAALGEGRDTKLFDRLKMLGVAVVFLAMAWSALSFVRNKGKSSSGRTTDFSATLMRHTGGRWVVAIIGLVIVGIGAYHVFKGVTKRFLEDLRKNPGAPITWIGGIGYAAKGTALGIVGCLFVVAAVQHRPSDASGLDGALSTLRMASDGKLLLTLMGLGLATYGIYSLARVRYARV